MGAFRTFVKKVETFLNHGMKNTPLQGLERATSGGTDGSGPAPDRGAPLHA